ncbi:MAG: response regulator transcription factor [Acidobacteriota bacterium]
MTDEQKSGAQKSQDSVLIVEDDPTLLRGLRDNFEMRGFGVRTAEDGALGLELALAEAPDLVILDIMLPKLNGYEVCRQLRAADLDMPIIMLTAKGQEADIVRGLDLGADDYVTKPFGIRELVARARAFLRRRRVPEQVRHSFGPWTLDRGSHKLFKGDEDVPLSPKEFGLLELFVLRAGRALTRDEILRSVWGGGGLLVSTRSVDRCVTTLRGKVEEDPRRPRWIHTIRDVGYRFEPD